MNIKSWNWPKFKIQILKSTIHIPLYSAFMQFLYMWTNSKAKSVLQVLKNHLQCYNSLNKMISSILSHWFCLHKCTILFTQIVIQNNDFRFYYFRILVTNPIILTGPTVLRKGAYSPVNKIYKTVCWGVPVEIC